MRRVLSIDGGGIKGVFPASFLAAVEEALDGNPVADYFDLIVGTSTGGIIALGLGLGLSAREILHFYEQYSPTIFCGHRLLRFLRGLGISKYSNMELKKALEGCCPHLLYLRAVKGIACLYPHSCISHTALDISPLSRDNIERGNEDLEGLKTMPNVSGRIHDIRQLASMLLKLSADVWRFLVLCLRPTPALAAEILFLRKQRALYEERTVTPRRATNAPRLMVMWLARWFDWRSALRIVQPETFMRWHRHGFRLFWRWKSKPGRPSIPTELQALIRQMAQDNPTWGQERIANELLLKLGLRVSPRTVRKYVPPHLVQGHGKRVQSQRWSTFIRNQAQGIVACDFCVVVTATFRILYVLVIIE